MSNEDQAWLYPDPALPLGEEAYRVSPGGMVIGRGLDADLCIQLDSVSRRHTRIDRLDGKWRVTDLDSSNGTFVNGEVIQQSTVVSDGAILVLGKARFVFRTAPGEDAPSAPPPVSSEPRESTSGMRLVNDDENPSQILSTRISEKTPFSRPAGQGECTSEEQFNRLNQRLLALYELSDLLREATERSDIIQSLMDLIFKNLPADRAVALQVDPFTSDVSPELFRFREGSENREFVLSRTITRRAITERIAVLSRDVRGDASLNASESIMASDIRSAMCVPLAGKRDLLGLIFLDTREAVHAFSEEDLAFASSLATDAAMTLENLGLMRENIQQERLAAVGQTISELAHNIKNILQLARGGMELMDKAISCENYADVKTLWPITRRSIERMQTLTQDMLDFSRQNEPVLQATDVNKLVKRLAQMIQPQADKAAVAVHLELDAECDEPVTDADCLSKALMNLLTNAFDALEGRPSATVTITTRQFDDHVLLEVQDNGPGIAEDILPKVFHPFFSTKGSKGNGLGLSTTKKLLEDTGARLSLESKVGNGCRFSIRLSLA